jgi:cytochrome c-type biogenesis protein CcmH
MTRFRFLIFCLLLVLSAAPAAFALHPDEVLGDPVLEARARAITREVRCLVCQGESVDESAAPLAADLRRLVRRRLMAGDSDDAVRAYLTDRYGDYILLRPPVGAHTLILWAAPFLMLAAAVFIVWRVQRRQARGG